MIKYVNKNYHRQQKSRLNKMVNQVQRETICKLCKTLTNISPVIYKIKDPSNFNCYLATPWSSLGYCWGSSLTNSMPITAFGYWYQPEGHWEPHNKIGFQCPVKYLMGFKLGSFQFWMWCLNPLGHSPEIKHSSLT